MVRSVVKDESEVVIPEGERVPVVLTAVSERGPFTSKKTGEQFTLLEWTFLITDGQYADQTLKMTTGSELTTHANNTYRNAVETLLGTELAVGREVDTDDLIGLTADAQVAHRSWTNRSGAEVKEPEVGSLFPSAADDKPPY